MNAVWQKTGYAAVPRWRLVLCPDEHPQRKARRLLLQMREKAPSGIYAFTECHEGLSLALVTVHLGPVGAHIADPSDLPGAPHASWSNGQDRLLVARGYKAGVLWALKQAAARARLQQMDPALKRYTLVPLPHVKGEILISHPSGWKARAIAWWQAGALASLAWCEAEPASLRRAC